MPLYLSSDTGAPQISGEVGKLLTIIRACLVNGYGSKPGAGWEEVFTGVNIAVFRATGGDRRHYLRVDDTLAQYACVRAYSLMSDTTDSGTDPYPNVSQAASGEYWYKSNAVNNTIRPWMIIADDKFFYFLVDWSATSTFYWGSGTNAQGYAFGEFPSFIANDQYNSIILGSHGTNSCPFAYLQGSFYVPASQYVSRSWTQGPGSAIVQKFPKEGFLSITYNANTPSGSLPGYYASGYPSTKLFLVSQLYICDAQVIRGILPGYWSPRVSFSTIGSGTHFTGQKGSDIYGRDLMSVRLGSTYTTSVGVAFLEVSTDTWYNGSNSIAVSSGSSFTTDNLRSRLDNLQYNHSDYSSSLSGSVLNKMGLPIPNCPMGLFHKPSMLLVERTITDELGLYSFDNLKNISDYIAICLDPDLNYKSGIHDQLSAG